MSPARRILTTILLATMAAIAGPARAQTEVQFWHAMDGPLGEALNRLVEKFNTSQKDVRVAATYQGDYAATLRAGVAAAESGKAPHLLQVYELGTADLMATPRLFKPAYQLALEWNIRFDREDYFPPIAGYYSDANGRLLALPFNASTPVLYFNRQLYAKAGLDPTKPPRTWQEMQGHLIKLQDAGVTCPYTTAHQTWVHLENLSAWHNQPVASHNNGMTGDRAELLFNTRLMIQHVSLLSAWLKSNLFLPIGRHTEAEQRFVNGECALITASSAAQTQYSSTAGFPLGVAQLPHHDIYPEAPYNTLLGGAAIWVMTGKPPREYQSVARFLGYLTTPAIAAEWHQTTGYVPMSRAAFLASERSGYYEKNPERSIAVAQLRGLRPGNFAKGVRLRQLADIHAIVDAELDTVWSGKKTPKEALDDAVALGNTLLKRLATTRATTPVTPTRTAPAAAPAVRAAPAARPAPAKPR